MSERTHTFKRDGAFIVATPVKVKEDRKFTNKDIVDLVKQHRDAIAQAEQSIQQAIQARENAEKQLAKDKDTLKELEEHYEWCLQVQQARLKALVEEHHQYAVDKVNLTYKEDPTLSPDQNLRQRFVQYRGYLAHHPQVAEEISAEVITDKLFINCVLVTPWPITTT